MSQREFSKVTDQRKAAFKRLRDAKKLLDYQEAVDWRQTKGKHARGAMYLAGYAIECKLKAIAMEVNRCRTLQELQAKWAVDERDVFAHGLESLIKRLPVYERFTNSSVWKPFTAQVNRWRPSWRYDPDDYPNGNAAEFVQAVQMVYDWLENNQ